MVRVESFSSDQLVRVDGLAKSLSFRFADGHNASTGWSGTEPMSLIEHSPPPAVKVVTRTPDGWYSQWGKRMIDVAFAAILLLLALPLFVVLALGLRLQLGPRIVLTQQRVGRHGRPFAMLKFRTMEHSRRSTDSSTYVGPERRNGHKFDADPRHTSLGRVLRRFSLDEIPQLFNVLRGDMSLVGPRPELDSVATTEFRNHSRHLVRPGLTGPFQVSPLRRAGRLNHGLGLDNGYVESVSLRNDLKFLARTASAMVKGTGS